MIALAVLVSGAMSGFVADAYELAAVEVAGR